MHTKPPKPPPRQLESQVLSTFSFPYLAKMVTSHAFFSSLSLLLAASSTAEKSRASRSAVASPIMNICGNNLTKPFDCHALQTILSEFSGSDTPRAGEDQTSFGSDGAAS